MLRVCWMKKIKKKKKTWSYFQAEKEEPEKLCEICHRNVTTNLNIIIQSTIRGEKECPSITMIKRTPTSTRIINFFLNSSALNISELRYVFAIWSGGGVHSSRWPYTLFLFNLPALRVYSFSQEGAAARCSTYTKIQTLQRLRFTTSSWHVQFENYRTQ